MDKLLIIDKRAAESLLKKNNLKLNSQMLINGNASDINQFKHLLTPNIGVFYKDLPNHIINSLIEKQKRIIIAESCTGGLISYKLSNVPGASSVFLGSYVSYSNDMKMAMLGITQKNLQKYTPYSKKIVAAMLNGAINNSKADLAIATSCIAGPSNNNIEYNDGISYIGIKQNLLKEKIYKFLFYGERIEIQQQVAIKALELLFRLLIRL